MLIKITFNYKDINNYPLKATTRALHPVKLGLYGVVLFHIFFYFIFGYPNHTSYP